MSEDSKKAIRLHKEIQHKFSPETYDLACHAALPVALSTELLHLIRINFCRQCSFTSEVDLLMSSLCHEIDENLYEVKYSVRDILLGNLLNKYSKHRITEVAALLLLYIERYSPWNDQDRLERAQELTALNFLYPERAENWYQKVKEEYSDSIEHEWFVAVYDELKRRYNIFHPHISIKDTPFKFDIEPKSGISNVPKTDINEWDLLIVDDRDAWRELIKEILDDKYNCDSANSYEEAIHKLKRRRYKIICANLLIESINNGRGLIRFLNIYHPEIPVILITGYTNLDRIQSNYKNIRSILYKGSDDFIDNLENVISTLLMLDYPEEKKDQEYLTEKNYSKIESEITSLPKKGKILVVDDQQGWRELLEDILTENDEYYVQTAGNLNEAIELLESRSFDLATIDMRLVDASPYNIDGMKVLEEAKKQQPLIKAIILTGYPDIEQKHKALNYYKADGYYEKAPDGKPFDIDEFKQVIYELLWPSESQKTKVFISCTAEDYKIAKTLYDDLKKAGITPWLDREDLLPGQNWRETIPRIIKASSYFLLIISENSVSKRGYIKKEQKIALEQLDELPSSAIFIIPARIDNAEPVDEILQNLHWANLSNYEQGLKQILKTIKSDKSL